MRRVLADEVGALAAIYDRHAAAVHGLAYRMVRERSAAEDVVQEVFLALWRSRQGYDPKRGSLRTWLLSITRNRAIDAIRRSRSGVLVEFGVDHHGEASERTDEEALGRLDAVVIRTALKALPGPQREAIELGYFGGLTQSEIAIRLGIPVGTVKGRMRLGLHKLATQLDPARQAVV